MNPLGPQCDLWDSLRLHRIPSWVPFPGRQEGGKATGAAAPVAFPLRHYHHLIVIIDITYIMTNIILIMSQ